MTETTTKKKLPPNAGKGKPPGTVNRTTKVLKEAVLLAAETVGEDGKGKNGLVGYLTNVAKNDRKTFCSALLSKVLPMQVTGPNDGPVAVVYGDVNSLSDEDLMKIIQGRHGKSDA